MPSRKSPLLLVSGASILMLAGCVQLMAPQPGLEQRPLANPWARESGLFYPLDIGNHWSYENTFTFVVIPTGGSPGDPSVLESVLDVDVVGTEERYGRVYTVQRETIEQYQYQADFLYRQDKSGLFSADPEPATVSGSLRSGEVEALVTRLAGGASPSVKQSVRVALTRLMEKHAVIRRAALLGARLGGPLSLTNGALPGEITLLQYPLAAGKTWHVREDPLFVYTVEVQEALDLPAGAFNGWRIRIDSDLFPPEADVRAYLWYGRDGLLQLRAQAVGEVTDENGNVIGTIVSDQSQALSEISLVKKDPS